MKNNLDLLKISQELKLTRNKNNKEMKEVEKKNQFINDLTRILKDILDGKEESFLTGNYVADVIGLKVKKIKKTGFSLCYVYYSDGHNVYTSDYVLKLTKGNIEKISKYINDKGFDI